MTELIPGKLYKVKLGKEARDRFHDNILGPWNFFNPNRTTGPILVTSSHVLLFVRRDTNHTFVPSDGIPVFLVGEELLWPCNGLCENVEDSFVEANKPKTGGKP